MSEAANKTTDEWIESYARRLAMIKGFRPDAMIAFGEPIRAKISGIGPAYLIPDQQQEVWKCFIHEIQCAMAVTGDLPGHPRED